jgi:hypothetical protein
MDVRFRDDGCCCRPATLVSLIVIYRTSVGSSTRFRTLLFAFNRPHPRRDLVPREFKFGAIGLNSALNSLAHQFKTSTGRRISTASTPLLSSAQAETYPRRLWSARKAQYNVPFHPGYAEATGDHFVTGIRFTGRSYGWRRLDLHANLPWSWRTRTR